MKKNEEMTTQILYLVPNQLLILWQCIGRTILSTLNLLFDQSQRRRRLF